MTIIKPTGVRVFFDNKLLGTEAPRELAPGPDTCDFLRDANETMAFDGKYTGTFTLDIESRTKFEAWATFVQRKAEEDVIRHICNTRAAPFSFYPPTYYHGDMMTNADNRRFMVLRPSNVGKTQVLAYDRLARLNQMLNERGTFGKLSQQVDGTLYSSATWLALMHDMITEPDEVRIDGKWHRANPWFQTPTFESINRAILRLKVRDICANWGAYK